MTATRIYTNYPPKHFGLFFLILILLFAENSTAQKNLRVGLIGLDTSHVIAFTKLLNLKDEKEHVPGATVVAAYKGGSADIEASHSRVDKFTAQLQNDFGIKIVDTIEELCEQVDAVLLESVDGRPHLQQVKPVFEAGLPVFIDKPLAGSLHDAIAIAELAQKHKTPWFSSSAYRYYNSLAELKKTDVGALRGAISYGPCTYEAHHPDLFWYGIHPTEALFAVMGTGCQSVVRTTTPNTDVVTGIWKDGKVGTLRGLRNATTPHKVILFGEKRIVEQNGGGSYRPLLVEIVQFFHTRKPPISPDETLEIFAFMEAADESRRQGGVPILLETVVNKAKAEKPL